MSAKKLYSENEMRQIDSGTNKIASNDREGSIERSRENIKEISNDE